MKRSNHSRLQMTGIEMHVPSKLQYNT
jgi:hypothetical protein